MMSFKELFAIPRYFPRMKYAKESKQEFSSEFIELGLSNHGRTWKE
jgi:hypothetical protein